MIDPRRRERLGALFQEEIADILAHRMADPRLRLVSVTSVAVSADLSVAKVYVVVHGEPETVRSTLATLRHAASFIRTSVAQRVRLRQMPVLRFLEDESFRRGAAVDRLLREWHAESSASDE